MRAALRSKQMKVNSSSNLVFFFSCHLIIFIPSAAGCLIWHVCCVSVCRTWRRQRNTSDTPRDWTPWSQLPSQAFPLTSPRLETYSPGQTTQFTRGGGSADARVLNIVFTCDRSWRQCATELEDETKGWNNHTFVRNDISPFLRFCLTCEVCDFTFIFPFITSYPI